MRLKEWIDYWRKLELKEAKNECDQKYAGIGCRSM